MSDLPKRCPSCGKEEWQDLDMETGDLFCFFCGEIVEKEAEA